MRILLLSPVPPSSAYSPGIIIERMCRQIPKKYLAFCTVINPSLEYTDTSAELSDIPHLILEKPKETGINDIPSLSYLFEVVSRQLVENKAKYFHYPKLTNKIVNFAKELNVTHLWVLLEGQGILRLADSVARQLKIPLYPQVTDPMEWFLQEWKVDRWTRREVLKLYYKILGNAAVCASPSEPMKEFIEQELGAKAVVISNGMETSNMFEPATCLHDKKTLKIGIAGQLYAKDAWENLLLTLNELNWEIDGRTVLIRYMGPELSIKTKSPCNIEFLGWQTQEASLRLLSECDLQYCPYPFSQEYKIITDYSFPTKLPGYFASGRPVFVHAPKGSSLEKFASKHQCAFCCTSLKKSDIMAELKRVINQHELYAQYAWQGRNILIEKYSIEKLQDSISQFLFGGKLSSIEGHNERLDA